MSDNDAADGASVRRLIAELHERAGSYWKQTHLRSNERLCKRAARALESEWFRGFNAGIRDAGLDATELRKEKA